MKIYTVTLEATYQRQFTMTSNDDEEEIEHTILEICKTHFEHSNVSVVGFPKKIDVPFDKSAKQIELIEVKIFNIETKGWIDREVMAPDSGDGTGQSSTEG